MKIHTSAPQKLYLLQLSISTVPAGAGRTLEMASGCYLIETGDGRHILIDSGLPADVQMPAGMPPAREKKDVIEHLSNLGLHPTISIFSSVPTST